MQLKYIRDCEKAFKTQFFKALATYCRDNAGASNYIHGVLDMALPDARALAEELTAGVV